MWYGFKFENWKTINFYDSFIYNGKKEEKMSNWEKNNSQNNITLTIH